MINERSDRRSVIAFWVAGAAGVAAVVGYAAGHRQREDVLCELATAAAREARQQRARGFAEGLARAAEIEREETPQAPTRRLSVVRRI